MELNKGIFQEICFQAFAVAKCSFHAVTQMAALFYKLLTLNNNGEI
jgi:hypothetical protein